MEGEAEEDDGVHAGGEDGHGVDPSVGGSAVDLAAAGAGRHLKATSFVGGHPSPSKGSAIAPSLLPKVINLNLRHHNIWSWAIGLHL